MLIQSQLGALADLCAHRSVRRLELFGSATKAEFDPATSDLDFLVEFLPMPPAEHANCFFGLEEDLEDLFGRSVDLVESSPIRNPYFLQAIAPTRVTLYAAA
jgi:predicted nucleotidyltransferase